MVVTQKEILSEGKNIFGTRMLSHIPLLMVQVSDYNYPL